MEKVGAPKVFWGVQTEEPPFKGHFPDLEASVGDGDEDDAIFSSFLEAIKTSGPSASSKLIETHWILPTAGHNVDLVKKLKKIYYQHMYMASFRWGFITSVNGTCVYFVFQ